jgi:hypothetical protein
MLFKEMKSERPDMPANQNASIVVFSCGPNVRRLSASSERDVLSLGTKIPAQFSVPGFPLPLFGSTNFGSRSATRRLIVKVPMVVQPHRAVLLTVALIDLRGDPSSAK